LRLAATLAAEYPTFASLFVPVGGWEIHEKPHPVRVQLDSSKEMNNRMQNGARDCDRDHDRKRSVRQIQIGSFANILKQIEGLTKAREGARRLTKRRFQQRERLSVTRLFGYPRPSMPESTPRIIAHAGGAALGPANTLAAIRASLEAGVDAIEVDVWRSSDAVPVLMHDPTVDRTTNGSGKVTEMTLQQLKELDAGDGEKIPTARGSPGAYTRASAAEPGNQGSRRTVRGGPAAPAASEWLAPPTRLDAAHLEPPECLCRSAARPSLPLSGSLWAWNGALGEIRTHDLHLRRVALYPAELRARALTV
jgi:Glycerophosphoryl diester phosphodiesterase family